MIEQHRIILAGLATDIAHLALDLAVFRTVFGNMMLDVTKAELAAAIEPNIFGSFEPPDMIDHRLSKVVNNAADIRVEEVICEVDERETGMDVSCTIPKEVRIFSKYIAYRALVGIAVEIK